MKNIKEKIKKILKNKQAYYLINALLLGFISLSFIWADEYLFGGIFLALAIVLAIYSEYLGIKKKKENKV